MLNNTLYIVIPYFNFVDYASGKINLDRFITQMSSTSGIAIVLVEGYQTEKLPDYSQKIHKHIRVKLPSVLWVKENLINLGVKQLPKDWQYMAWVDRDILFTNDNWVNETLAQLGSNDLVQPWTECVFLNDNHEHTIADKAGTNVIFAESFCSLLPKKILTASNWYKGRHAHPGQAWAIGRKFYDYLGGLYDKAILGGADSLPLIAKLELQKHPTLTGIQEDVADYLDKLKEARLGCVRGLICHYKHGEATNRQYVDRHKVMVTYNYKPSLFLTYNSDGVLAYTAQGKVMESAVRDYFVSRRED